MVKFLNVFECLYITYCVYNYYMQISAEVINVNKVSMKPFHIETPTRNFCLHPLSWAG